MKHVITALCLFASATAVWAQDATVRVVVAFHGDPDPAVVSANGGTVIKALKHGGALVARIDISNVGALRASNGVASVEEDIECSLIQNQPSEKAKPGPSAPTPPPPPPPQETPWGVTRVNAATAWATTNGSGVIVGISDTGIDTNHPDLAANYLGGWNSVSNTALPEDDNGHGTHVSGTVAAVSNSLGVVGVAPGAKLYAAKGLNRRGSGYASDLADTIHKCADNGARIISMSWGSSAESGTITAALVYAQGKDVLCVAAAGNEGASNPGYPAATAGVLSVGATDSGDGVPYWSNRNPDISAPGVSVLSTWKGDTYNTISGTSMATPHVSGVAALVRAAKGTLTWDQVASKLTSTAQDKGNTALYGAGIVNAAAAVAAP